MSRSFSSDDPIFKKFSDNFEKNVFIMIRFRQDSVFRELEDTIRSTLTLYGLTARLAKDVEFSDEIWTNVRAYMENSKYGIAIFEEIDVHDYNPNISMELGYLYALDRKCLLLKDKRMLKLPADISGKQYKDFDTYDIAHSVGLRIKEWCEFTLGLTLVKQDQIHRTELDRYIAANIDKYQFKKRESLPDHVSVVLRKFDRELGETKYILWNQKEKRLRKLYKEGVHFYGPSELDDLDEREVRELLGNT
jgi:hypothetical protein